ncbi:MAG: TolC family protein [Phycisphaerales bacterium JB065]
MTNKTLLISACAVLTAFVGACSSPFQTVDADYGVRVRLERLRTIEPLDLQRAVVEPGAEQMPHGGTIDAFETLERQTLTLEECRALALRHNLDLRVALIDPTTSDLRVSEEEAAFEAIFTAGYTRSETDQPTASNLDGSQTRRDGYNLGVSVPLRSGGTIDFSLPFSRFETDNSFSTLNPSYTSDFEISYSQPLLRDFGRRASTFGIRIAAIESQITQALTKLEVIRTLAAVDRAYWDLYAAQKLLEVRRRQYELAVEQLNQAERRVRAGDAAEIEITRAQSGVADQLEAIILAETDVRSFLRNLKVIINAPGMEIEGDPYIEIGTDPDPVPYQLNAAELIGTAMNMRMELLELELRLAQDESTIEFRKNQQLPSFAFDYTYRYNGLGRSFDRSFDQLTDGDFADWSVGFNFQTPIGNEAAKSRTQQAVVARLQRLSTRSARELAIRQEVVGALDQLEASWQRILAARQRVLLAARTLEAEQNQFNVGLRTSTDVLDAATNLADAQSAEVRALADYQIAQTDLAFATGTLLGASKVQWAPIDPRTDLNTSSPDGVVLDPVEKTSSR